MKTRIHNPAYRTLFAFSILMMVSLAVSPAMALRAAAPAESTRQVLAENDNFASAFVIAAIPYHYLLTPFEATEELSDPPSVLCNRKPGLATVWYKYVPGVNTRVHMDTFGSNYDTYMVLFSESGGILTELACNDDASPTNFASSINATLAAGVTYYIEVAQYNGPLPDGSERQAKEVPEPGELKAVEMGHVFRLVRLKKAVFKSIAAQDGFVVESSETSGIGLLNNSTLPYFRVGDDEKKRQYRAILSFDTSSLHDNAVITFAFIKVKRQLISGGNVFDKLGNLKLIVRSPYFGAGKGIEAADFSSPGTLAGVFSRTAVYGWFRANLRKTTFNLVDRMNTTQYRLQFSKDDNNDSIANHIKFYSGETTTKPILVVMYYVP